MAGGTSTRSRSAAGGLIRPMLATAGPVPGGPGWAFEVKFDGVRAIGYAGREGLRLYSRNDRDISRSYPEVAGLELGKGVIVDGELVALDEHGRPDFGDRPRTVARTAAARAAVRSVSAPPGTRSRSNACSWLTSRVRCTARLARRSSNSASTVLSPSTGIGAASPTRGQAVHEPSRSMSVGLASARMACHRGRAFSREPCVPYISYKSAVQFPPGQGEARTPAAGIVVLCSATNTRSSNCERA